MVNRKYAQFSTSIETIYPLNDDDEETDEYANFDPQDSDDDFELDNTSTKKFSTGRFMILYVISGDIKVAVDGEKTVILNQGSTMIYEKCDDFHPSDVSMIPIAQSNSDEGLGASKSNISNCVPCATVMTIQLQVFKYEKLDFATSESPLISPALSKTNTQRDHRGRAGSIIVYDDQPGSMIEIGKSMIDIGSSIGNLTTKTWQSAHKYIPPKFSARYRNESDVPPAVIKDSLEISDYPNGTISTAWINMVKEGLSEWIRIPVIIAKGTEPGPVVGITAVVHGNELNGVPCIHRVITDIDVNSLKGTVVAVPCVNVPGYLRFSREFSDGKDLNRQFPGSQTGTASQVYNYCFFEKIIRKLNYLIDLHTASFGRVNSYYVRSDLNDPVSAAMAKLQQPQIILHNSGQDGTLRSAASACGIKAITVEIGNPQLLQNQFVQWSYMGVMRILAYLNMFSYDISDTNTGPSTLVCSRGFWIYTTVGGVLEVYPAVNTLVRKGDLIARIKNIFGNIVNEVFSPSNGVVFLYYAGNRKKFKSCGNDWRSSLAFGCS
jgi:predicted deacylase